MTKKAYVLNALILFLVCNFAHSRRINCIEGYDSENARIACNDGFDTGGLSRKSFPEGFVFGTATSAYQVEGMADKDGRGPCIWDVYAHTPGHIANNATADVTVDQYHRYKEDIDLMKNLNFDTFGDRVKNWYTFNEPRVIAALGFDDGSNPPSRCSKEVNNCTDGNSGTEPYIAAHNMILAHAAAVQRYREKYQETQKGKIGILLDFVWYEPHTRSKADNLAAQRARDFHIGWFLHPLTYGEYPRTMQENVGDRLPKFTPEEVLMVQGSFDYLGVNQYTSYYMFDPPWPKSNISSYANDWDAGYAYDRNGVPIGPRANSGWLYIVPWGLYNALMYVKERYGNPIVMLSENGMDDPSNYTVNHLLHDTTRVNYYRDYISQLKKAADDGANVTGYFAWSLLDNFEWLLGYSSRFGITYVDFDTLKRTPKMSAYWFKQLLQRDQ
ncbi:beta-glucosidase 43-like isoform X3 [Citrus sinensis]|uniref:beta-glucosidase 43-like isoform X3 n=1 Tax=Citrus sinensis TaxID=2711 RepID=UPI002278F0C9|nr:beta-glucosidase 43-like isoform X3 [Citrus sinensis]